LKLPPTPTQVEDDYGDGDPLAEKVHYEKHASELTDSLSKAHIQDNAASAVPPPLPARGRGPAVVETAHDSLGVDPAVGHTVPASTVNLDAMDPAEAREWQQHLEQEEADRLAAQRQSLVVEKHEQQSTADAGNAEHQSAQKSSMESERTVQQPIVEPTRPATSLSHAEEDVFHDADAASELPPVYSGAPANAVPVEKSEEREDLR
jgi:hypothetical protein